MRVWVFSVAFLCASPLADARRGLKPVKPAELAKRPRLAVKIRFGNHFTLTHADNRFELSEQSFWSRLARHAPSSVLVLEGLHADELPGAIKDVRFAADGHTVEAVEGFTFKLDERAPLLTLLEQSELLAPDEKAVLFDDVAHADLDGHRLGLSWPTVEIKRETRGQLLEFELIRLIPRGYQFESERGLVRPAFVIANLTPPLSS